MITCRDGTVWGVSQEEFDLYKLVMESLGYCVDTTLDPAAVAKTCNLIVTVTPARHPLLHNDEVRPGTHITAIGADTPEKQELDSKILARADIVVADSIEQCQSRGEIYQATKASLLEGTKPIELGNLILNQQFWRSSDDQLTIADLTGVAVQDLQISKAVYKALS